LFFFSNTDSNRIKYICVFYFQEEYQLLAHGRWFSPGTPASSTSKTGRHDIDEILLKVVLKHQKAINPMTVEVC
jgi:hypothetical protein